MFQRISKVKSLTTTHIIFSSTLQIGDCSFIDGTSYAMAVHRNSELLLERENQFSDYPIFSLPTTFPILNEPIQIHFENPCPFIEVGHIRIIGMTISGITGIGNVGHIRMQSRLKNIRDLLPQIGKSSGIILQ